MAAPRQSKTGGAPSRCCRPSPGAAHRDAPGARDRGGDHAARDQRRRGGRPRRLSGHGARTLSTAAGPRSAGTSWSAATRPRLDATARSRTAARQRLIQLLGSTGCSTLHHRVPRALRETLGAAVLATVELDRGPPARRRPGLDYGTTTSRIHPSGAAGGDGRSGIQLTAEAGPAADVGADLVDDVRVPAGSVVRRVWSLAVHHEIFHPFVVVDVAEPVEHPPGP